MNLFFVFFFINSIQNTHLDLRLAVEFIIFTVLFCMENIFINRHKGLCASLSTILKADDKVVSSVDADELWLLGQHNKQLEDVNKIKTNTKDASIS